MFNPNHFIIGIVPSITDEALFYSSLTLEIPHIQFSDRPLFLPISPSFEISDRTLNYFVKEIEVSIAFLHSMSIDWGNIKLQNQQSELSIAPTSNQVIHTIAKYIRNAIIDSRFVSAVIERNHIPELAISIPISDGCEEIETQIKNTIIDFSWHIESISFLQLTDFGWREKFFLPLAEQRKERTKSHAILPCI